MSHATIEGELAAIRALMSDSQNYLCGTWRHQLVWGVIGALGMVATWVAETLGAYSAIAGIWLVAIVVGWVYSIGAARNPAHAAAVQNAAGRAFSGIWIALGVTLTILGTVSIATGSVDPTGLPGVISVVFGAGYFASGFLADLRWLIAVGIAWWVGGVALLVWGSPMALLALAVMTLALEVGPALVLRGMEQSAAREA